MALLEKMAVAQWKLVRAERREAIVLRRIPGREAGGHARTARQIPGTLRSRLLPRPPRTRETTENPPPNGPTARQRSPPPFYRVRARRGAVPRLNRGTLWVRRSLPQTRRISPTPCPP